MDAPFDLTGRRVVITGGTSGIGLACARAFAAAGASVIVSSRSSSRGQAAVDTLGHGVRFIAADAGREADAERLASDAAEAMGGLDTLICAAGINRRMRPEALSVEDWDAVMDANLKGTFLAARAAYPMLKASGDGRIVTVGSMLSQLANETTAAYASAKGGVVQLTRSLAAAWAGDGIRANCILPGWIDTDMTRQARIDMPDLDRRVIERTPVARWGRPEEISGTALFLAAPASSFITGAAIPVDGGFLMKA